MNYRAGYADFGTPEGASWVERADRYAAPETLARVWADFGLAFVAILPRYYASPEARAEVLKRGFTVADKAIDLSLRLNDAEAFWFVAPAFLGIISHTTLTCENAWRRGHQAQQGGCPDPRPGLALLVLTQVFLEWGQYDRAIEMGRELKELAERTGQGNAILLSMEWQAALATIDGRLDEAVAIAKQVPSRGEELGIPAYAALVESQLSSISLLLGDREAIRRQLGRNVGVSLRGLYAAYLGESHVAEAVLQRWLGTNQTILE